MPPLASVQPAGGSAGGAVSTGGAGGAWGGVEGGEGVEGGWEGGASGGVEKAVNCNTSSPWAPRKGKRSESGPLVAK